MTLPSTVFVLWQYSDLCCEKSGFDVRCVMCVGALSLPAPPLGTHRGGDRFLRFSGPGLLASLLASNRYIKKMPRKY